MSASAAIGPFSVDAFDDEKLICEDCGYSLRGLDLRGNCPECGLSIEESINQRESLERARHRLRLGAGCLLFALGLQVFAGPLVESMMPRASLIQWIADVLTRLLTVTYSCAAVVLLTMYPRIRGWPGKAFRSVLYGLIAAFVVGAIGLIPLDYLSLIDSALKWKIQNTLIFPAALISVLMYWKLAGCAETFRRPIAAAFFTALAAGHLVCVTAVTWVSRSQNLDSFVRGSWIPGTGSCEDFRWIVWYVAEYHKLAGYVDSFPRAVVTVLMTLLPVGALFTAILMFQFSRPPRSAS